MLNRMLAPAILAPLALAAGLSAAAAAGLGPLVTAAELQAAMTDPATAPVILDIRGAAYDKGHIEGAISAPYALFRGPASDPGQIVPVDQLEATYEKLGLELDRPVVIVAQGDTDTDFGGAARVYWTLKSSGFTQLSVLNGGEQVWVNNGLPVSTDKVEPEPTELAISWNDAWTATTPDVDAVVAGTQKAALVDARPPAFFEGKAAHPAAARPGTLPGAESYPYTNFFQSGATAITPGGDAGAIRKALGIKDDEEVVSFCNTGHWAATNWFAMSELAGMKDVKLYPGSMVEYSQTDGKMEHVPGLVQNLLNQFKGSN